jgi:putative tricarboxylic transport membrane protein
LPICDVDGPRHAAEVAMRRVYVITGLTFLLLAVFLGYHASALRYYTPLGPGPGFFPVWLCGLLGLLAVVVIAQAVVAKPEALPDEFFATRSGYRRIAAVLLGLLAVAILMPTFGFRLTMLVFYVALPSLLGRRHPLETLLLAFAGSFGVFYLFVEFLSQPLPVGIFGI